MAIAKRGNPSSPEVKGSAAEEWPEDPLYETARQYQAAFPAIDPQSVAVYLGLIRAMGILSSRISEHLDSIGLGRTRSRYTVLRNLYFSPDNKMAQNRIGAEMGISKNTVTSLVDGLVQDGLVVRSTNPTDRRVIYAQLTEEGVVLCQSLLPEVTAFMMKACENLTSEEKVIFMNYLTRFSRSFEGWPGPTRM